MKKHKAKRIEVYITHQLTPFHEKCMEETLDGTLKAFTYFWQKKSKKYFEIVKLKKEINNK